MSPTTPAHGLAKVWGLTARPDEGFEYDKLGNRTTLRNDGAVTTQYTHNTANEYLTVGGTAVYYDAAGNLTRDHNGYQYAYDPDNRLILLV